MCRALQRSPVRPARSFSSRMASRWRSLDEPIGLQAVDQAHRRRMRKRQHAREQLDRVTGAKADMHQRRNAAEAAALTVGQGLVEPVGDGEGDGAEKVSLAGLTEIHASCIYCLTKLGNKRWVPGQTISARSGTPRAPGYG